MQFNILGSISLQIGSQAVRIGATKTRCLLGVLLLSPNTPVAISTLEQRLWDEPAQTSQRRVRGRDLPPKPHKTLQIYVARLRTALRNAHSSATLSTENRAYRLNVDPKDVDYHQFRALTANGRRAAQQGNQDQASAAFAAAIALWRGPPIADLTTSWANAQRDTLIARDLLPAYYGLFEAYLALGQYELILEKLNPLLSEHDTDETFAGQWMRAIATVDGPDKLPGFFRAFSERFLAVMDANPGDRLVHLFESLTQHQPPRSTPAPSPVSASRPRPRQLPRPTPSFVGREDVLARLDDLLLASPTSPPIVAIDGPPGIGKSALVIQWASQHPYRGGEFFVNLGGHGPTDPMAPTNVLAALLDTLEIPADRIPDSLQDRTRLLSRLLADRQALVVLDNARDSDHVRPILAAMTACTVLITSRQQLTGLVHRDGAQRITLPTLAPRDSIRLLGRRLGKDRAERDHRAIQDLASLCDGLPLGLQIAAEHVAARPNAPIGDLVKQLNRQRRIMLDAGSHGDDNTVTLRAVFSWSYEALTSDARRLFRLLGLLPIVEFGSSVASALAGLSTAQTHQVLDVLLGASLVEQRRADRFRLHDLLRLFSAELVSDEDPAMRRNAIHRVLDWFLGTVINAARQIDPHRIEVPQLPLTSGITPQDFHDEDEAFRWCIAEYDDLLVISRYAVNQGFHDHAWRLIGEFDEVLPRYRDPRSLLDIHQLALQSARTVNSREGEAGLLNNLGFIYFYLKDYEQANHYLRGAQAIYRELGDTRCEAVSAMNVATACVELGDFHAADRLYGRSIKLFTKIGSKADNAHAHHRQGNMYLKMKRYDRASRCYQTALRLRQQLGRGEADTLTALGGLHLAQGDAVTAIGFCEDAVTFHRRALDERRTAEALEILAIAYCRINRYTDAIPHAAEAAERYRAINDLQAWARLLSILGEAHNAIGDYLVAQAHWNNALAQFAELNDPYANVIRKRLDEMSISEGGIPEPRTTPMPHGRPAARGDNRGDRP